MKKKEVVKSQDYTEKKDNDPPLISKRVKI